MKVLSVVVSVIIIVIGTILPGTTNLVSAQGQPPPKSTDADLAALKAEVERLKREVGGIQSELQQIREFLLQRSGQPTNRAPTRVSAADNPALGKADAPVTIIEFSDYQCPYCRQFFETTLPVLTKQYVEGGKLRYVFHDFPLDQIHPQARKAAEAARCAGEQGNYWQMHDVLFRHQDALQADRLRVYAEQLHLDGKAFGTCLDSGKYQSRVQRNYTEGLAAGVRGTPSFLLGKTRADNAVEGILFTGARPVDDFRQAIDRLLADK